MLRVGWQFILAVLPATRRVDFEKLSAMLGGRDFRMATEQELTEVFFDCEWGALPPFGHLYGLTTLVDESLSSHSQIVVEGNMRHEGLGLSYRDFEAIEAPRKALFSSDPIGNKPTASHRCAGG
jgi:Ala-tRNA(Pro) deacylase